ncbi:MAG: hypothetical protein HC917_28670 [Richelia sp. SM2_1_7]|nr:hypothetical protein [Richelia sp. SM2_1_7]
MFLVVRKSHQSKSNSDTKKFIHQLPAYFLKLLYIITMCKLSLIDNKLYFFPCYEKDWRNIEKTFLELGIDYKLKSWVYWCKVNNQEFYYSPQKERWRVKGKRFGSKAKVLLTLSSKPKIIYHQIERNLNKRKPQVLQTQTVVKTSKVIRVTGIKITTATKVITKVTTKVIRMKTMLEVLTK